jgi:hypothetical protein
MLLEDEGTALELETTGTELDDPPSGGGPPDDELGGTCSALDDDELRVSRKAELELLMGAVGRDEDELEGCPGCGVGSVSVTGASPASGHGTSAHGGRHMHVPE